METMFLSIFNMSITAGYVILAVIIIRFLLKRAPKKYSYLLWTVVLFRLICPASFSSAFSMFSTRLFNMATARRGGGAVLRYIPADIGYAQAPRVTVGIPAMNTLISDSLPVATPTASVNPLQIWILLGTILWCTGLAAFLIYGIVAFIRLKTRMATAVQLENNVFESDKIRSPFVLGFTNPRIYIPFGLGEHERIHILQHEAFHLKRKDHLIKALGFLVLAIHWFNPLVWIAFILMAKDMEMSCDEKVLSVTGAGIAREYSASLLSFAANRRFPAANPLAFGETGIRERIKNILRFKAPTRWVTILSAVLCIAVVSACASNPAENPNSKKISELYGNYVFEKQIYMNFLSSFLALDGFIEYYTLSDDMLIITSKTGAQQKFPISAERTNINEQEFKDGFFPDIGIPDISVYKERYQYTLTNTSSGFAAYRIYQLDNQIWLAKVHRDSTNIKKNEYVWSIYRIKRLEGQIPVKAPISGTRDGVDAFLSLQKDFQSGSDPDVCYNITPENISKNSGYSVFKYDASCASFLLYEGKVYPLGQWFGGLGVTSMALADMNGDGKPELYFTYSWGSGLHRSHVSYFDPAAKEIVGLEYVHLNRDMLVYAGKNGGLSLYDAVISGMDSFVKFDVQAADLLADIAFENGRIVLKPIADK